MAREHVQKGARYPGLAVRYANAGSEATEVPRLGGARAVVGMASRIRRATSWSTTTARTSSLAPQRAQTLTSMSKVRASRVGQGTLEVAAKSSPQIVSFLSGFDETGGVIPQLATKPSWAPRYEGSNEDIAAQAEWLYSIKRELTVESLKEFRESLGIFSLEPIHTQLIAGGWCYDDGRWMPERDYYSGLLWDRYERARQGAKRPLRGAT